MKGIGMVNLVYYQAELDRYWIIDYRLFDPEREGKTKLDHVTEMLDAVEHLGLKFGTVLMDAWSATVPLMTRIHRAGKLCSCPIKKNRLVAETRGQEPYRGVESLGWTEAEEQQGKLVKVKGFAQDTYLKLFRVVVSTDRTDYIVTNDVTQSDTGEAQQESGHRWKVEQFHREEKQVTGIERCQCRLHRSPRNHLCASMLVWLCFKELADRTKQTVYQLKHGLLSDYLKQQLRNPSIAFS
jgi:hypothetical protein